MTHVLKYFARLELTVNCLLGPPQPELVFPYLFNLYFYPVQEYSIHFFVFICNCILGWVNLYKKFKIEKYTVCGKLILPKKWKGIC